MRFGIKLLLAATSGALVAVIAIYDIDDESLGVVLSFLYFYGVSGALFATAILWPYLRRPDRQFYRLALIDVRRTAFRNTREWTGESCIR
jgi:hypothetical protein